MMLLPNLQKEGICRHATCEHPVILPVHFVGQPELSDPAHHWLMVNGHKKVSGAFCDVFYNQARPCDRHQSNPLNGPMTRFCGNRIETVTVEVLSLFKVCLFLEGLEIVFVFLIIHHRRSDLQRLVHQSFIRRKWGLSRAD